MSHRTRRIVALSAGVLAAFALAVSAAGSSGGPGDKVLAGDTMTIPAGETVNHDVYAFGGTVTVAGTIDGDLVTAAARVVIDGTVTGDVFAAGSEVMVHGTVGGDFRSAAAQLVISGSVGEDAAVAVTTLELTGTGRIGQDLLFTGGQVTLDGNVAGGIAGSATDYLRHGTVSGTEDVTLGDRTDQPAAGRTASLALDALRQYVVVVLFGLVLLRFAPALVRLSAERVRTQPLVASGAGVIGILGAVGVVIVLIVTMVFVTMVFGRLDFAGLVAMDVVVTFLAAFGVVFGLVVFSAFIADAIVGLALGRLVSVADTGPWGDVIRLLIGSALVVVVTSFPEIGAVVKLLVILVALGAAGSVTWQRWRSRRVAVGMSPPIA